MYHRLLSDQGHPDMADALTRDVRAPLLAQARGRVLEIGAGDGSNLPLYPPDVRLTLLDPNPFLLRHASQLNHRPAHLRPALLEGVGERLPFPDNAFDTLVATHVLCSVRDQARALAEIRRTLRPGGRFLFLEHVAAPPDSGTHRVQRVINPVWRAIGDGCHLTRDTGAAIRAAGFAHVELRTFDAGFPAFVSLHIVGTAHG